MPMLCMAGHYLRQGNPSEESITLVGCGNDAVVWWWRKGKWIIQQSIRVRELQQVFVKASKATHQGDIESVAAP